MSQQHFVGLDVSVKETAICVVDPQGRVVHRAAVESHPAVISQHLLGLGLTLGRVGLEAGPLSPWLYAGLVEAALPAIMQKAVVAVARKLAIVLHRMWRDGTDFRWSAAQAG